MRPNIHRSPTLWLLLACLTIGVACGATFSVTQTADSADGAAPYSLRDAVIAANATASTDTISLPAGTYSLTLGPVDAPGSFTPATGDLDASAPLVIQGASAATTLLRGNNLHRILESRANLILRDVTLSDARTTGGLPNEGAGVLLMGSGKTLMIERCRFTTLRSAGNGGAVALRSIAGGALNQLNVANSLFTSNTAACGGGAIALLRSSAQVTGSTFTLNRANVTGSLGLGGGAVLADCGLVGQARFDGCSFTTNTSSLDGGALLHNSGSARLRVSTLRGNRANRHGGAMARSSVQNLGNLVGEFQGCNLVSNRADADGNSIGSGGAAYNFAGPMNSVQSALVSRLLNNQSAAGANLFAQGAKATTLAENCWWGSHAAPGGNTTSGGAPAIDVSPQLLLTLSAGATILDYASSTNVTADLNHNSTAGVPGGTFPLYIANARLTSWNTNYGTLAVPLALTNGRAAGTFSAPGGPANALLSVRFDNQLVTTTLKILGRKNGSDGWGYYY